MTTKTIRLQGVRTVSTINANEHWSVRTKRARTHRGVAKLLTERELAPLRRWFAPVAVKLTRVAPRRLDDDNAIASLKAARDGVADALGIDDGDSSVTWSYDQQKGKPREYAVIVEVSDDCGS